MNLTATQNDLVRRLQKEVLSMQSSKRSSGSQIIQTGLPSVEAAFPNKTFPTGGVHEFLSNSAEDATATNGFIAGLLRSLLRHKGTCLWAGTRRTLFPPALTIFGINPERIIFIDCNNYKEVLWTIEEALKCEVLSAVVGELREFSFKESRRLQLVVEQSSVTGFIHRYRPRTENTVACITRWKIKPLLSQFEDRMPGVGFPRWNVQLLKVRNGNPGSWDIEWSNGRFNYIEKESYVVPEVRISKAI